MKTLAEQIGGRCKHFTGLGRSSTCAAGVVYSSVTVKGKGFSGLPCFRDGEAFPCEKRCFPSHEEVAAEVAEHDRRWEMLKLAIKAAGDDAKIHGFKEGSGGTGSIACPVCKSGDLRYTVSSYNGHMWGRCSTDGCVSWMQ